MDMDNIEYILLSVIYFIAAVIIAVVCSYIGKFFPGIMTLQEILIADFVISALILCIPKLSSESLLSCIITLFFSLVFIFVYNSITQFIFGGYTIPPTETNSFINPFYIEYFYLFAVLMFIAGGTGIRMYLNDSH